MKNTTVQNNAVAIPAVIDGELTSAQGGKGIPFIPPITNNGSENTATSNSNNGSNKDSNNTESYTSSTNAVNKGNTTGSYNEEDSGNLTDSENEYH
jgi:hypothetical protein